MLPTTHQTPQGHLPTSGSADSTPPQPWGPGPRGSGRTRMELERRVAGGRSSSLCWHRDAVGPAPHPGAQQRKARWGPASGKVYAQRAKAWGALEPPKACPFLCAVRANLTLTCAPTPCHLHTHVLEDTTGHPSTADCGLRGSAPLHR